MARETFVFRDGKMVRKEEAPPKIGGVYVMPDIKAFRTQEGVEISSRSSLRAYEQSRGVRQIGNDIKAPWNHD